MKHIFYIYFLFLITSCSSDVVSAVKQNTEEEPNESKSNNFNNEISEITNVLVFFEADEGVRIKLVKDKETLFWCYDVEDLLKIDILGRASNVTIDFKQGDDTTNILTDGEIDGSYTITPTSSEALLGGEITIKSKNKVIFSFEIEYTGCD